MKQLWVPLAETPRKDQAITVQRNNTITAQRQPLVPRICSAALVGQAVLNLRRQARNEISGFRYRKLLNLASALESTLPAIEALEPHP